MADNFTNRGANPFADNDPFAELSRIMGGAPRTPQAQPVEDEAFDLDLEREMLGDFDEPAPQRLHDGSASYIAPSMPVQPAPVQHSYARGDDDFAAAFEAELGLGEAPVPADEAFEPQRGYAVDVAHAPLQTEALADVDMDFGDLDFDVAAEQLRVAEPSLEDELTAMLTGAAPAAHAHAVQAPAYGRANFARDPLTHAPASAAGPNADEVQPSFGPLEEYEPDFAVEDDIAAGSYASQPAYAGQAQGGFEDAQDIDLSVDDFEDLGDEFRAQDDADDFERALRNDVDEPQPAYAESTFATPSYAPAPQPAALAVDPFSVFSTIAPQSAPVRQQFNVQPAVAAAPVMQPQPEQPADMFSGVEDFSTVSVAESNVPTQDDLDLPDLQFDDAGAGNSINYDAEMAHAFGDTDLGETGEPLQPQAVSAAPARPYDDEDAFAEAIGMSAASVAAYAGNKGRGTSDSTALQSLSPLDDFGNEFGPEQDDYAAPYREPARPARRRGGLFAALAVGAVVVLGGAGVLALGFGGGSGSDTPVLVKADADPIKVKPENTAGTANPAHESSTYQRVEAGKANGAPAQNKLVTAAEEPVNLAAREAQATASSALPGVEQGPSAAGTRVASAEPAAKAEDRLAVQAAPEGVGAEDDLAAVQPRRVRTMVVRPDGTLVPPRATAQNNNVGSLLVPANAAQQASPAASVAVPAANAIREVSTRPVQTTSVAAPQAAAPALPANRPAQQPAPAAAPQQQVAQAAAPAAARTNPAPAPVATAPAGASEWSMQIASQPTAESAQTAYQDLARRYNGVLSGQGVNIVRADVPGKGTYFRVRIPSQTRADAIALCERYKSAGGSCFVSK